jgi:hypothetical protein
LCNFPTFVVKWQGTDGGAKGLALGHGEIAAEDAIGEVDSNLPKGNLMRAHGTAERGRDGYSKPIPDILSIIKDSYEELRPAERRVADVVLADVTFAVDASNAEISDREERGRAKR